MKYYNNRFNMVLSCISITELELVVKVSIKTCGLSDIIFSSVSPSANIFFCKSLLSKASIHCNNVVFISINNPKYKSCSPSLRAIKITGILSYNSPFVSIIVPNLSKFNLKKSVFCSLFCISISNYLRGIFH